MAEPTERDRELFADELVRNGEPALATMVQAGLDNSNGGTAALRAIAAARKEGRREAIEECSADAARYRWLRDSGRASYEDVYGNHKFVRDDNIDLEISSGKST